MKKTLTLTALLVFTIGFSQLGDVKKQLDNTAVVNNDTIDGWKRGGTVSLLFNQSAFSNWVAGGVNNVAGNANINYDANYKKGDWTWDNKLIFAYGLSRNEGQETRKTDDRIELNSLLGKKAWGNWSYSFFANFRTQFTDGYNYDKDAKSMYATSGLFKPAYLTFGPGMLWKKSDNLKFNIAPLTSKITYIGDEIFLYNASKKEFESSKLVNVFGVEPGENIRYELGMYAAGYYKLNLMKNVSMENILALYSNYLEDPQNIDIDYTMNLVMQINKYLSTNFTVQAVYDDNAIKRVQLREVFGLGVNFTF